MESRVIVRLRPQESMSALDLARIKDRLAGMSELAPTLIDSRLSDATYVTVIANLGDSPAAASERLKQALRDLPGVTARLYLGPRHEVALATADRAAFDEAIWSARLSLSEHP